MLTLFCFSRWSKDGLGKADRSLSVDSPEKYHGKSFDELDGLGWKVIHLSGADKYCWILMEKDLDTYRK